MNETQKVEIALLAKSPEVGQVKKRLAQEIGATEALNCYNSLLQTTLVATRNFSTTIWYEGNAEPWSKLAPEQPLRQQPKGDLGFRMFTTLFEGAKLVLGADIPCMNSAYIRQAANKLSSHDVVIGPTEDGGYCLIGMNSPQENLFTDIAWGSDLVLEQTLSRSQELEINVTLLPTLWDVDTATDYHRWLRHMSKNLSGEAIIV